MEAVVEKVFIAPEGGADMVEIAEAAALAHRGLSGDRYCERRGYYTGVDECEVTLIEAEHLEEIERETGLRVREGEHRRNLVTRGVRLESLAGKEFRIGEVVLAFDRPRPPCAYIQSLTQPGMTRALWGRGGICARVVQGGTIKRNDRLIVR